MTDDLLELQKRLNRLGNIKADLRSPGSAEFLFVRSRERAAEISVADDGYFIECWNTADEESTEGPVCSEVMKSSGEVMKKRNSSGR